MRKIEINNTNYVQSPLRVIVDDGQTQMYILLHVPPSVQQCMHTGSFVHTSLT